MSMSYGQRQVLRAENLGILPRFSPIVTQRACSYSGSPYVFGHKYNREIINPRFLTRAEWDTEWRWRGKSSPSDTIFNIDNENLIIPGDLLFSPNHVSMVYKIVYTNNQRRVVPNNVYLVEVAYAEGAYMAVNHQTWGQHYGGIAPGRYLGRLRINQ